MAAVHQGLQQQPLVGGQQQPRQLLGGASRIQLPAALGGFDLHCQSLEELIQQALALFAGRTALGALQLGEQHPHQTWMVLVKTRMAAQQGLDGLEGIGIGCAGLVETLPQFSGGPVHRLSPESFAVGEVAKQGRVADTHGFGHGRGADLIGSGVLGQFHQSAHRPGAPLGGGNGGGAGQAGK